MLQVGEIQRSPPPLFPGVSLGEIPHQGQKLPRYGAHRRHILGVGGAVLREKALQLLHGGAAGVPPGLGPGGHGVVPDAFVAPQGGKADILAGGGFIPALLQGQGEVFQVVQGGAQGGAVARLRLGLGAQALQGFLHLPAPKGGEALRPVQQGLSPGGLPRVGKGNGGLHLPPKPGVGVRVALHSVVGVQHHVAEGPVALPGGEGVHQGLEAGGHILIAPGQHVLQRFLPKDPLLRPLQKAEIRADIQQLGVFPQDSGAEGMDGADPGLGQQQELPPEMGAWVAAQPFPQGGEDPPPQLCRGGAGIGDDEETVQVPALGDAREQTLHQHPRLAAAGPGGDEQGAAPMAHGPGLGFRQLEFSHAPPPSAPAARTRRP